MRRSDGRVREEQDTRRLCTQRAAKEWLERGRELALTELLPFRSLTFLAISTPPYFHPLLALREGGVAGVEGGLAPKERCLSPPGRQKEGGSDLRV